MYKFTVIQLCAQQLVGVWEQVVVLGVWEQVAVLRVFQQAVVVLSVGASGLTPTMHVPCLATGRRHVFFIRHESVQARTEHVTQVESSKSD